MTTPEQYPTRADDHERYRSTDTTPPPHEAADHPDRDHPDRDYRDRDQHDRDYRDRDYRDRDLDRSDLDRSEIRKPTDTTRTTAPTTPTTGEFRDHDTTQATSTRTPPSTSVGATQAGDGSNKLFSAARAEEYSTRWNAVKGEFVDEPRRAVDQADQLVGELLDELHDTFSRQRRSLDHGLDADQTTTEDLRVALGRYREFFDRLLSL